MSPPPLVHVDLALAGTTAGQRLRIPDDVDHHLRRVLRLSPGAPLVLGDGAGTTLATRLYADAAATATADAVAHPPRRPALHLIQALPKARKLDAVVRVATELGVERITPVAAARSVPRLRAGRARTAQQRWQAVARAAAGQARNPWMPVIDRPATVDRLSLDGAPLLVAEVGATGLADALAELELDTATVAVAVGPEGGWSDDELGTLGGRQVGLGPTVLRTEHAAASLLAVVSHHFGRSGMPPGV